MSYQPRSTNPYIMEKKLNNCVGGGGFDPSVLEEIEAEISVLGSENATMAQNIIDIKGSLNSLNDNLTTFHYRVYQGVRQISDDGVNWENFNQGAELIWTNSAPSARFDAQTLSIDLSDYESIIIETKSADSNGTRYSYGFASVGSRMYLGDNPQTSGGCRNANINTNSIVFYNAYYNQGTANNLIIPQRILGFRNSPFN